MKTFVTIATVALALTVGTSANAVTVAATEIDDVTISANVFGGADINGEQFRFTWDLPTTGDTGAAGLSAAVQFSIPGAAKISFDDYTNGTGSTEQTGFVLYQLAGGPNLTSEAPAGVTGGGVPFVD